MGKRSILIRVMLIVALAAGVLVAGDGDKAWFDLEGCAMCKNFAAEPGLMEHIEWENHMISDGVMTISVVDEEYQDAMKRAEKKMAAVGQQLAAGEQLPLCGFCTSYGKLMMAGTKIEQFDTKLGTVVLMTSSDPKVVEMIQQHARHTDEEYEKIKAAGGFKSS
jgi:hypothetical protein